MTAIELCGALTMNGTYVVNYTYDPERDAQGNWLKCDKKGSDNEVIEHEIEYYE